MSNRENFVPLALQPGGEARHALVACGMWTGLGFVGASTLGAALASVSSGGTPPLLTLATGVGGGVLAALAWRCARAALGQAESAGAMPGAGVPRPALTRFSSGY